MEPHIDVITLAVSDLERSFEFYRDGLGLEACELVGTEYPGDDLTPAGAAAMFKLTGGLMLMLYPRSELAKDANIAPGSAQAAPATRRAASSALATWFPVGRMSMLCSPGPRTPGRRSPIGLTIVHGASTPATSATSTGTCGRSSGTQGWRARRREIGDARGAGSGGGDRYGQASQTSVREPGGGYSGGTWLLTCVPWYRWSWVLQGPGKLNWTLSLRTPL